MQAVDKLRQEPLIGESTEITPDLLAYSKELISEAYTMKVFAKLSDQMVQEKKYGGLIQLKSLLSTFIDQD